MADSSRFVISPHQIFPVYSITGCVQYYSTVLQVVYSITVQYYSTVLQVVYSITVQYYSTVLQVVKLSLNPLRDVSTINTHSYSALSSFGGDGLIPKIRFSLVKDPLRFSPAEPDVGCM